MLPTATIPTPQPVLMAWRAAVICTERGNETEFYSVVVRPWGGDWFNMGISCRTAVNCSTELIGK